jgi:hypothetical protein
MSLNNNSLFNITQKKLSHSGEASLSSVYSEVRAEVQVPPKILLGPITAVTTSDVIDSRSYSLLDGKIHLAQRLGQRPLMFIKANRRVLNLGLHSSPPVRAGPGLICSALVRINLSLP